MKLRRDYLHKLTTLGDTGVESIGLNFTKPITSIDLIFQATIAAGGAHDNPLSGMITSIEIVDGSHTIFSMPYKEAAALSWAINKSSPKCIDNELGAASSTLACTINFGRYKGDKDFYLDPMKYNNLQLKITTSLNTTYFDTTTLTLYAIANLMEDAPGAAKGVLMSKSHFDDTSAASGVKRVDLPVDFPYLAMMLVARITSITPQAVVTNFKLIQGNGDFVPLDLRVVDLLTDNEVNLPEFACDVAAYGGADGLLLNPIWQIENVGLMGMVAGHQNGVISRTAEQLEYITDAEATAHAAVAHSTSNPVFGLRGYAPYGCVPIFFGDTKMGDVLPVQGVRDMRAELTNGTASAQLRLIGCQLAGR